MLSSLLYLRVVNEMRGKKSDSLQLWFAFVFVG